MWIIFNLFRDGIGISILSKYFFVNSKFSEFLSFLELRNFSNKDELLCNPLSAAIASWSKKWNQLPIEFINILWLNLTSYCWLIDIVLVLIRFALDIFLKNNKLKLYLILNLKRVNIESSRIIYQKPTSVKKKNILLCH